MTGDMVRIRHVCPLPSGDGLGNGTVWRCECGKRWTWFDHPFGISRWRRRFWPWPR